VTILTVITVLVFAGLAVNLWRAERAHQRILAAERAAFYEQTAARSLGYTRRADHPWSVNQQRAPVVEPEGALGEQVSGRDFTR
jgi:hypothetical protein